MTVDYPAAHSMDAWWFAVDQDGHVAYFDTGENGAVPVNALTVEAPHEVLRPLLALRGEPGPSPEEEDDWYFDAESVARLGLFGYGYPSGFLAGPYPLWGRPESPLHIDQLPPALRQEIKRLRFATLCFEQTAELQPCDYTRCEGWGPAYLCGDGRTVRPIPGREDDYREWCRRLRQWSRDLFAQFHFEGLGE